MKWFRHINPTNGYWYDFIAIDIKDASLFAEWKFISPGIVGEIS